MLEPRGARRPRGEGRRRPSRSSAADEREGWISEYCWSETRFNSARPGTAWRASGRYHPRGKRTTLPSRNTIDGRRLAVTPTFNVRIAPGPTGPVYAPRRRRGDATNDVRAIHRFLAGWFSSPV